MLTLGVDPGAVSGAYAILDEAGDLLALEDLPTISSGKLRWVDGMEMLAQLMKVSAGRQMQAIVERQGGRPGQSVSAVFTSATAFGALLATLQIANCSIELVTPTSWKRASGLSKDKSASLDKARLLYPNASLDRKKDHGRAEAILIAVYGMKSKAS